MLSPTLFLLSFTAADLTAPAESDDHCADELECILGEIEDHDEPEEDEAQEEGDGLCSVSRAAVWHHRQT